MQISWCYERRGSIEEKSSSRIPDVSHVKEGTHLLLSGQAPGSAGGPQHLVFLQLVLEETLTFALCLPWQSLPFKFQSETISIPFFFFSSTTKHATYMDTSLEDENLFIEQVRDTPVPVRNRCGKAGHTGPSASDCGSSSVDSQAEESNKATGKIETPLELGVVEKLPDDE